MDTTKFQTSFIPKKPVTGMGQPSAGGGLFYTLSIIIFITTILISVGVFGYQKYLEGNIKAMDTDLVAARQALEPDLIKELTRTNDRFVAAEQIISKHEIVSGFFNLLENITLQSVSYSSLSYVTNDAGVIEVSMKGLARSYASVALQAKMYGESEFVLDSTFSDLDLNDVGDVTFTLKARINPETVSYEALIKQLYESGSNKPAPSATDSLVTPNAPATATSTPPNTPVSIPNTP
jgi:hypothetical protein